MIELREIDFDTFKIKFRDSEFPVVSDEQESSNDCKS